MKRLIISALLAAVAWSVPAFGAENVRFLRNGEEVRLSHGAARQEGVLVLPLADLAALTQSELREDGDATVFGYRMEGGSVVLEREQTATLVDDTLYDRHDRKIPLGGKILRQDGETCLPVRDVAEALGYTVKWSKAEGVETLSVEQPVMPRLTLDVAYDKDGQRMTGTVENREPQCFTYGEDFTLERMTENGWERMREAEPRDINDVGYTIIGRLEGLSDGKIEYKSYLYCPLPAGHYRVSIPFSYRYNIGADRESVEEIRNHSMEEYWRNPSPERLWSVWAGLEVYFSTRWGSPTFFYEGADMEPVEEPLPREWGSWDFYESRINTDYILYGEFDVE